MMERRSIKEIYFEGLSFIGLERKRMEPTTSHTDTVLTTALLIPRAIGTFPFDRSFKLTPRTVARSLILLIFFTIASPYFLIKYNLNHRRLIKTIVIIIFNIVSLMVLIRKRCQVHQLYEKLLKVEDLFLKEGIRWKWMPGFFRLYFSQIFLILDLTVVAVVRHGCYKPYWIAKFILYALLYFPFMLSIISQITMLQAVLSSLFDELFKINNITRTLEILSELHSVNDVVMSIYGIQTLFFTTITILFIVSNVYYLSYSNFSKMGTVELTYVISIFITFYPFMEIIVSSRRATAKAREVDEMLYEKISEDSSETLINNEQLIFHLNSGKELEFSACGFFKFDNSLIFSIFACSTTYLVILTQSRYPELVEN
ncbi:Gustatory receptor 97 [Halyomorpha halys]|nr:Gustatory receptor 97 [Halyomorpha halys]